MLLKAVAYCLDRYGLLLLNDAGPAVTGASLHRHQRGAAGQEDPHARSRSDLRDRWSSPTSFLRNVRLPAIALGAAAASPRSLIGGIYPAIVQQFRSSRTPSDKEAPYIGRNIEATRQAYGIDANGGTVNHARTTAPTPTSAAGRRCVNGHRRRSRTSACSTRPSSTPTFTPAPADPQRSTTSPRSSTSTGTRVNGRTAGLRRRGPRARRLDKLTGKQTNWLNRHTVYTHGYGFVAAPANTDRHRPGRRLRLHRPGGTARRPAPHQGRPAADLLRRADRRDYSIVGSTAGPRRRVRPAGSGQRATRHYRTPAPAACRSALLPPARCSRSTSARRTSCSPTWSTTTRRSSTSATRASGSRRSRRSSPSTATRTRRSSTAGSTWIVDGYTTSATYPYSQQVDLRATSPDSHDRTSGTALQAEQNINYIRNSVKATVDAYDGTVTLYEFDDNDPVLKAWNKAFGGNIIKPE